jgi:glycosyltransferase involved in cell wall biosynthesis
MTTERLDLRPLVLLSGLATGGAERVTVAFARRLKSMGLPAPVCTVTARYDGELAADLARAGVERHDLGARRLADPRAPWRLARLLARERIDLVHAHGQDASIVAAAVRRLSNFVLVVTRHVMDEPTATWRERLRARLACAAFRRADAVVAVSGASAERLAELARIPREAVRVLPNGIDLAAFDGAGPEIRAAARRALAVAPADALVLVPAVLREGKGHDVLLEAVPALLARVPSARVIVAGGGEREAQLRGRARPLGDAVRFLGPREDMRELLAACDVVALPSLAEAQPTALMEAAAAGRPVVATRVGGVPEVVADGRSGILVPPRDAGALAEALAALLADPARARAYGECARQLARERFAIELQVERTLDLWSGLVARRA